MEAFTMKRRYLPNCTISELFFNDSFVCHTIEQPWRSNEPFQSCVPPGIYKLLPISTPNHKDSFILLNHNLGVGLNEGDAPRYACLIHVANFPHEVQGCIGPGIELHPNTWGVSRSKDAMLKLRQLYDNTTDWILDIKL